jgi:Mg-chelatase subunit ChlD
LLARVDRARAADHAERHPFRGYQQPHDGLPARHARRLVVDPDAVAEAAELGLTVQQVDSSQYPKVRVEVSVADSQGVPITGLDRQAFELYENNQEIGDFQIEPIINSQEPVAIALVIDVSGSMASENRLDHAKQAAEWLA